MSDTPSITVLVVDDDADQLIIRCMLLTHHGFETRRAADAATAIAIAREQKLGIAVVDARLPTEEIGLSLIREIKALLPGLNVIVLTGAEIEGLKAKPEITLIREVIQKGSSSKALLNALDDIKASLEAERCYHGGRDQRPA